MTLKLIFSAVLLALSFRAAMAQPYVDMGQQWRYTEMWRAKGLFNDGDLTPVDEAFARKDLIMLWSYFRGAFNNQFARPRDASEEAAIAAKYDRHGVVAHNAKIGEKARGYLLQMPGHAQFFGDEIESLSDKPGVYQQREGRFIALGRLGSEECIQQLGRFLFDQRNPDKGSRQYYIEPPSNDEYAVIWLHIALGEKSPLGKDAHFPRGALLPPKQEKLREWWLTSEAAAPYRRGLVASGVVLPPGYPAFPEAVALPAGSPSPESGSIVTKRNGLMAGLMIGLIAAAAWLAIRTWRRRR